MIKIQFLKHNPVNHYDPFTTPPALTNAHHSLDRAVDRLYRNQPFASDAERVAMLFELYMSKNSA